MMEFHLIKRKFSKIQGCIREIPLNPPFQKGEAVGMSYWDVTSKPIDPLHWISISVTALGAFLVSHALSAIDYQQN